MCFDNFVFQEYLLVYSFLYGPCFPRLQLIISFIIVRKSIIHIILYMYTFIRFLPYYIHLYAIYSIPGYCNATFNPPRCTNCSKGWMGQACEELCVFGNQVPIDSGICKCNPCYTGKGCNVECTGHGKCENDKCNCNILKGWRGSLCEVPGCPGIGGKDCSGHGTCDSANHKCICDPGKLSKLSLHCKKNNIDIIVNYVFLSML